MSSSKTIVEVDDVLLLVLSPRMEENENCDEYEDEYEYDDNEYVENNQDNDYNYEDDESFDTNNVNDLHIPNRLQQYFQEFHQIYSHAQLIHRDTIASTSFLSLIFPISELLFDNERLHALGLQKNLSIRIEFVVDCSHLHGIIDIRSIQQYDPISQAVTDFELTWLLKKRISEYLKEIKFDLQHQVDSELLLINEVIKNTNSTHSKAKLALESTKWNVNDAVIYLMDRPLDNDPVETKKSPTFNNQLTIDLTKHTDEPDVNRDLAELEALFSPLDFDSLLAIYQSTNCSFQETFDILESNSNGKRMSSIDSKELLPRKRHSIATNEHEHTDIDEPGQEMLTFITSIIRESYHFSIYPIDVSYPNKFMILLLLIEGEILTCGLRCLLCNNRLTYPGILPAVCGGKLCVMGYEELGVGIDLQREIIKFPLIMDLYISFLYSAVLSSNEKRLDLMFPSAIRVYGSDQTEHSFTTQDANGTLINNHPLLQDVVNMIPSVSDLARWSESNELKDQLNLIHPLIYPLLLWLVQSNRTYLRLLDPDEVPEGVRAKHVFALTSGPMEKDILFQKLRNETLLTDNSSLYLSFSLPHMPLVSQNSSFFLFHGSSFDNWHSILRVGLRNFSNTIYMTNGAAYGSGVYFSPKLSVSSRYAPSTDNIWKMSEIFKGKENCCLAICEIINSPGDIVRNRDIYVVKKEEYITPRFLVISPHKGCIEDSLKFNYDNLLNTLKGHNKK